MARLWQLLLLALALPTTLLAAALVKGGAHAIRTRPLLTFAALAMSGGTRLFRLSAWLFRAAAATVAAAPPNEC